MSIRQAEGSSAQTLDHQVTIVVGGEFRRPVPLPAIDFQGNTVFDDEILVNRVLARTNPCLPDDGKAVVAQPPPRQCLEPRVRGILHLPDAGPQPNRRDGT